MNSKFNFYEVVKVVSPASSLQTINGLEGIVLGMSVNEQGAWGYAVYISNQEETWDVMETELQATGIFQTPADFYDGSSLQLRVTEPKLNESFPTNFPEYA
jgi:Immunity protein 31